MMIFMDVVGVIVEIRRNITKKTLSLQKKNGLFAIRGQIAR